MEIDPIQIRDEAIYRVPEHEMLLSFNNDSDAVLFWEWWQMVGEDTFKEWAKNQPDPDGPISEFL